jgi:ribosomal protein L6P/L9E
MRGLGLKAFFIKDYNILQLKLGFSKIINVSIPDKKIKLFLTKRRIIIVGYNIIEVNKFAFKIKLLKLPNIYKGKGLWYKNEKIILKTVRKT